MIFGKQLCQSYQKLAQLSRTHFVFFRNHSTAEKLNFQWHASFGFIEFFWKSQFFHVVFDPFAKMIVQNIFFQVWKKIKLSLIFLCVGEARTSLTFFMKQNKFQLGPPWKMMTNQNFHCLSNPLFFLLENQFYKISHYTVNKYQGSSNFWTVWPILKIQNAK